MSKVFITKNGQFLSRGEGVLTQIENPDLEVNDIGVEVSEKIAEDVKEGDLLFKYYKEFDRLDSYSNFRSMLGGGYVKFVDNDGELYLLSRDGQQMRTPVFVYENEKWKSVVGQSRDDHYRQIDNVQHSDAISFSGTIYQLAGTQQNQPFAWLERLVGDRMKFCGWPDVPITEFRPRSGGSYNGRADDTTVSIPHGIEGEVHYSCFVRPPDWTSNNPSGFTGDIIHTFKYNPDSDRIIKTNIENSFDISGEYFGHQPLQMFTLSGTSYGISRKAFGSGEGMLYSWNSSTQTWEFVKILSNTTNIILRESLADTDDVYATMYSNIGSIYDLKKYNPSTQEFDILVAADIFNIDNFKTTLIDSSGGIYRAGCSSISYSDSSAYYVPSVLIDKYNTSTSSWDRTYTLETFNNNRRYSTSSTGYIDATVIDLFHFDNKLFVATANENSIGRSLEIFTIDLSNGEWTRHEWKHPFSSYGPHFTIDTIEYNGSSFIFDNSNYINHNRYDASTDTFINGRATDVGPGSNVQCGRAYIQNSKLYYLTFDDNIVLDVYEYVDEHDQLFKLAEPSGIPNPLIDGFRAPDKFFIHQVSDSDTYVLWNWRTDSRQVTIFKITDTNWTELASLSSLTSKNADTYYSDSILFDNKIWYSTRETQSTLSGDVTTGTYSYDLATSTWSSESIVSSLLHNMTELSSYALQYLGNLGKVWFTYENELYYIALADDSHIGIGSTVFKYNSSLSGFVEDHAFPASNRTTPKRTKLRNIDGKPVIFITNSNNGGYAWPNSVSRYEGSGVWHTWLMTDTGYDNLNYEPEVMKTGDTFSVFYSGQNFSPTMRRLTYSEFANQSVWEKKQYLSYQNQRPLATGIALQDGSKGDIIKIRRIKR